MAAHRPSALVVVFPGSNGDGDLLEAFTLAGFAARRHDSGERLPEADVVGLPGGFSYGDYWRAGMLASQARAVEGLLTHVARGGLVIGICNGFQILVEAGLLPGALLCNSPPGFRHRWLTLRRRSSAATPWLAGLPAGAELRLPMAHGEGNYYHPRGEAALAGRVPLAYADNPNGSLADAAALLDDTGRILGIMPHPERAIARRLGSTDGLQLFAAAYGALTRGAA
jgi:phosphoribosylformylglycinamidine synthase subunit PurQ / glutaminase